MQTSGALYGKQPKEASQMVKRYDMREFDHSIERYEDGSLVSYDDYAALAERCERLEAALRNLADSADDVGDGYNTSSMDDYIAVARGLLSGSSGGKNG